MTDSKPKGILIIGEYDMVLQETIYQFILEKKDITLLCIIIPNVESDFFADLSAYFIQRDMSPVTIAEAKERIIIFPWSIGTQMLEENGLCLIKTYDIQQMWLMIDHIEFSEIFRDRLLEINVETTRVFAELAKSLHVREVYFLSSAFVENNTKTDYIKSKRCAEEILYEYSYNSDFMLRILRPVMLVDTYNYRESTFTNILDQFIWVAEFVSDRSRNYYKHQAATIFITDASKFNVIPVDGMVRTAIAYSQEASNLSEELIIIGNSAPLNMTDVTCILEELIPEIHIKLTDDLNALNPIDKMLNDKISPFQSYIYEKTGLVNLACVQLYIDYYQDELFCFIRRYFEMRTAEEQQIEDESTRLVNQMERMVISCRHGSKLEYCSAGNGPPILISNALGPNVYMWKRVIARLCKNYRVIVWETRGLKPDHYVNADSGFVFGFEERAIDIGEIMNGEQIDKCHILCWCSGTRDALRFRHLHPDRVKSLILIAGNYTNKVAQETEFINNVKEMASTLSQAPRLAPLFVKVLAKVPEIQSELLANPNDVRKIIYQINPKYIQTVREGILNKDGLLLFCKRHNYDLGHDCTEYALSVNVPTLVVNGQYDGVCNPLQSEWLHQNITGSQYVEIKGATHYIPLENWLELSKAVEYFLDKSK